MQGPTLSKSSIFVIALLLSSPLFSQDQLVSLPPACGDLSVSMAVNLDANRHSIQQPEPGKALIYFIQDTGKMAMLGYPTTKIGIDGKWAGANKKDSYFSVAVEPGEHHLCAAIQSSFITNDLEFAHLAAEAGKTYYFRTRIFFAEKSAEYFSLAPADIDEASYLVKSYPLAISHARK
jgi:Protein of unknown function (DUF2846)